jgi:hypothetical protein
MSTTTDHRTAREKLVEALERGHRLFFEDYLEDVYEGTLDQHIALVIERYVRYCGETKAGTRVFRITEADLSVLIDDLVEAINGCIEAATTEGEDTPTDE